jgi:hypothetical protein
VNLVRLAVLSLSNPTREEWDWEVEIDKVALNTHSLRKASDVTHILIAAQLPLASLPSRSASGRIVIDEELLRRCERAIESFADLAAVAARSSRTLSSPTPEVAFSSVSKEERAWLDESAGVDRPGEWRGAFLPGIDLSDAALGLLDARPDGVALLAEALSIDHPTGRFRELLRVFERGFKRSPYRLVDPVAEFLAHFDVLQYGQDETHHWFVTLRDKATHADKREDFALARDVEPVLSRVEQAAYDVLFNKANWRSADTERRAAWLPEGGVLPDGSGVIRRDGRAPFVAKTMDGFEAFPLNLQARMTEPYSSDWWLEADLDKRLTRAGRIEVVESLRTRGNT